MYVVGSCLVSRSGEKGTVSVFADTTLIQAVYVHERDGEKHSEPHAIHHPGRQGYI